MTRPKPGANAPQNAAKSGLRPPWKPGQSGNPKGKPRGTRHKATLAAQALLDGEAEALSRKAVELALEGDTVALRLCLERIAPPRRDAPVTYSLPKMQGASDALAALSAIVQAVAAGDLTPTEAAGLADLVEKFRRTAETDELARRVEALEEASR